MSFLFEIAVILFFCVMKSEHLDNPHANRRCFVCLNLFQLYARLLLCNNYRLYLLSFTQKELNKNWLYFTLFFGLRTPAIKWSELRIKDKISISTPANRFLGSSTLDWYYLSVPFQSHSVGGRF